MLWQWVFVFFAVAISDVFWTFCVARVQDRKSLLAGSWAFGIALTQGLGQVAYVNNPWLIIAAALGAFAGTALTVELEKRFGNTLHTGK